VVMATKRRRVYRSYLTDPDATIPKTTEWRLAKTRKTGGGLQL